MNSLIFNEDKDEEGEIVQTPPVYSTQIGYKDELKEDGSLEERTYLMIVIQGNEKLGYVGYVEYWFSPNEKLGIDPEFYLIEYSSGIVDSAHTAFEAACRYCQTLFETGYTFQVNIETLIKTMKL